MKRKIRYLLITKTVPEWSKRDQIPYTCSLGISPELGLIRIYPLPMSGMDKYGIYELEVEKNKWDSRNASWKLASYARKDGWIGVSKDVKFIGKSNETYVGEYLSNYIYPSISELNKQRKSIGVLDVSEFTAKWDVNSRFIDNCQIGMFEDVELADYVKYTKDSKQKDLRIIFRDGDGEHNLQMNEWHYFEGQRQFGALPKLLEPLNRKDRNLLLIGNQLQYQNNWMGLGKFKSTIQVQLF